MKFTKDFEILELPDYLKFGIEIEAFNVKTKGKNGLYVGRSAEYIESKNWKMASKKEEQLVKEGGAELVSPVLTDTEKTWKDICDICEHIKKFPRKQGEQVIADDKCGLHIHFDADCLAKNPQRMKNFLRLYAESEELIYKMCNDKNNPIRTKAINKDFKGMHLISALWRNGMAAPTGKKILKKIEDGTLKVSYKKFGKLRMLASKYKIDERRYAGLNLTNIGNSKKNTIEFRMANGTLDPEIIKQNVFLYSSLINTAIGITEEPFKYEKKLTEFYKTEISEKEKAERFLNLVIDNEEDKQIYMDRWESVNKANVFNKNYKKGFAQNRFKREQFKNITERTLGKDVHNVFLKIKNNLVKTKEEGEYSNVR